MPLDVLEADHVGRARNCVDDAAPRRVNVGELDLMLRVLRRDDPLRRSYIQRRWHGHPATIPLLRMLGRYKFETRSVSPNPLSRR
jgi:hypothetical protein